MSGGRTDASLGDDILDSYDIDCLIADAREAVDWYDGGDADGRCGACGVRRDDHIEVAEGESVACTRTESEAEDLARLLEFRDDVRAASGGGRRYGVTLLIHDSYFEDYAREYAEDIGAIERDCDWPACHIDWAAAARSLQQDYSEVEVGSHTYWVRS